jgi:radical SAM protein with 4Fe4S-binding SPASM domain
MEDNMKKDGIYGGRINLAENIPLNVPLSVYYFPTTFCNFRCSYCLHGQLEDNLKKISFKRQNMGFDLYKKSIDSITEFQQRLKSIIYVGMGEPLLHKNIADMVAYAKEKEVTEKTEIITNGSLLSRNMSDNLINAGLDRLRVSIQGINAIKYKEISGVNINFSEFLDNLRYFYRHKNKTFVYIKIIDMALTNKEEEAEFYRIFSDICDEISVEHTTPYFDYTIDYSKFNNDMKLTKEGEAIKQVLVCPIPFYSMTVMTDGNVCMCSSYNNPFILGKIDNYSIVDMWNSKVARDFRIMQLKGERYSNQVCGNCNLPRYLVKQEDIIDHNASQILSRF